MMQNISKEIYIIDMMHFNFCFCFYFHSWSDYDCNDDSIKIKTAPYYNNEHQIFNTKIPRHTEKINLSQKEKGLFLQKNQVFITKIHHEHSTWYAWCDSNARPSESESDTLSSWATGAYNYCVIICLFLNFVKVKRQPLIKQKCY